MWEFAFSHTWHKAYIKLRNLHSRALSTFEIFFLTCATQLMWKQSRQQKKKPMLLYVESIWQTVLTQILSSSGYVAHVNIFCFNGERRGYKDSSIFCLSNNWTLRFFFLELYTLFIDVRCIISRSVLTCHKKWNCLTMTIMWSSIFYSQRSAVSTVVTITVKTKSHTLIGKITCNNSDMEWPLLFIEELVLLQSTLMHVNIR